LRLLEPDFSAEPREIGVDSSQSAINDERTREFLRLLGQHERRLLGFILALVPHWADADDIAQEVKIRLWEQFDQYDSSKDFGAWARTIAHYQILTYRGKKSRYRELFCDEFVELVAKETNAVSAELETGQQALADCFEKLPETKRELLLLYYSGRRTTREIAAKQGRSFDATRQSILRARLSLSDCVEEVMRKGEAR
jgi:RNA polymerase sigma-70 factor, ECF subfamily